jgi:hypothetical protein
MTSTATRFTMTLAIRTYEGGTRVFDRNWTDTFPTDHI